MCGLLVGVGVAAWLLEQVARGRLSWRRTPLDLPVLLLFAYLALQLVLGNRALVAWALAPGQPVGTLAPDFPAPFLSVGSVRPGQTLDSTLLFACYVAVYYLVVNAFTTRRDLGRLARVLVTFGGLLGFFGLLDYLAGETWLLAWRDFPDRGRLAATWGNPDHLAAWLAMTILLGLGWLAARTGHARRVGLRALLGTPRVREELLRRYLPMIAVVVMALALVFTLSRGGVLGLGAGLLVFLALLGAVGHARRSALLAGVLLVGVGGYGAWIGVGPLLTRFGASSGASLDRVAQYQASLGMLRDFPLLGVGLGAYREIYFRYQPAAHAAGVVYYPYAHNDVLQLLLELGPWARCSASSSPGAWSATSSPRTCSGAARVRWTAAKARPRDVTTGGPSALRSAPSPAPSRSSPTASSTSTSAFRPTGSWWPRCSASPPSPRTRGSRARARSS